MTLLRLFFEFCRVGLFSVGGGLATIPFLTDLGERTGWFGAGDLANMIAISESTPGPMGVNMATYVGYNIEGVLGGIVATLGIVLPAVVIVTIVSKSLERFHQSKYVEYVFSGFRPAVTGLIAAAGLSVIKTALLDMSAYNATGELLTLFSWPKILYCAAAFFAIRKFKKHPVVYIAISAAVGLLLKF